MLFCGSRLTNPKKISQVLSISNHFIKKNKLCKTSSSWVDIKLLSLWDLMVELEHLLLHCHHFVLSTVTRMILSKILYGLITCCKSWSVRVDTNILCVMVFRGRKFGNFPFRKQKEILPWDELTELSEILKKDYVCFIRTYLCIPINGAGLQNVLNTCSRGFNKNVFSTVSWVNDKNVMELPNSMND